MKIAILLMGDLPREIADVCYQSIRKHMDYPIVHQTDLETEKLWFADEVQRIDEPNFSLVRFRHMAAMNGEVLSLDYDTVVQKDVSDVFNKDFHVALTKRTALRGSKDYLLDLSYPHNLGVIFSRSRVFWEECLKSYKAYPKDANVMIAQVCATETAHLFKDQFNILELDADRYNYTPKTRNEDVSERFIVHYKGQKKCWMVPTKHAFDEGNRVAMLANTGEGYFSQNHPNMKEIIEAQKENCEHHAKD